MGQPPVFEATIAVERVVLQLAAELGVVHIVEQPLVEEVAHTVVPQLAVVPKAERVEQPLLEAVAQHVVVLLVPELPVLAQQVERGNHQPKHNRQPEPKPNLTTI